MIGSVLATVIGYGLAKSHSMEKILSPFLVASQAVPTVAIAPLLVIWFGPGMISKVIICALTVFFRSWSIRSLAYRQFPKACMI